MTDIIIPQYKTIALTIRCIESIVKYTKDFRIILIDDGTPDKNDVRKVVSFLHKIGVSHVFSGFDRNCGFGPAVRCGMERVESEFFVLMNNDVVVTSNWLDKLFVGIRTSDKIAIIAPVTDHMKGICSYVNAGKLVGYKKGANLENFFNNLSLQVVTDTDVIPGFCTLMRKGIVWGELGGYDIRFLMAHGDRDLNDRIKEAGYLAALCLNCFVYHDHAATTRLLPSQVRKKRLLEDKALLEKNRRKRAEQHGTN